MFEPPNLITIKTIRRKIDRYIVETPVWHWHNQDIRKTVGLDTKVFLKLELFQHTGSFKPRGALTNMLDFDQESLQNGVTTVSAGNHAIAVGYAANILGTSAKVVMPKTANPYRISKCRAYGTEVVLVDNVAEAFEKVSQIENEEGRILVHPFEGPNVAVGTATVGLEFCSQVPDLDAVIIPIGGGGLCAGIATAVKLLQPKCQVFGVEPEGADTMHRSFASGKTESIPVIKTIADSLGSPRTEPYSLALCRRYVDQLVMVDDDQIREAMASLFFGLKMAVEPAGAAALAALFGPLREQLRGKNVGVIVSGTNIDPTSFTEEIKKVKW